MIRVKLAGTVALLITLQTLACHARDLHEKALQGRKLSADDYYSPGPSTDPSWSPEPSPSPSRATWSPDPSPSPSWSPSPNPSPSWSPSPSPTWGNSPPPSSSSSPPTWWNSPPPSSGWSPSPSPSWTSPSWSPSPNQWTPPSPESDWYSPTWSPSPSPSPPPSPGASKPPSTSPSPVSPPPPPPCGSNTQPFCRLFVENVLCNATQGLISPRPWLRVDVLCSQPPLQPIPPKCISVQGPLEVLVVPFGAARGPAFGAFRYHASWESLQLNNPQPEYTGALRLSFNTSAPGCELAIAPCALNNTGAPTPISKLTPPSPVNITAVNSTTYEALTDCMGDTVWRELDNLAWTDGPGNIARITLPSFETVPGVCGQQVLGQIDTSFIEQGGFISFVGGPNVCKGGDPFRAS